MGITAFSTALFPRVPPETVLETVRALASGGGGMDPAAVLRPYLPLAVAMGALLALPLLLGLGLAAALVCVAPCRCSACCRRCCCRELTEEKTSSRYRCCCFYAGLAANVLGLCGCVGVLVAAYQPLIGVDGMFRVAARTADRVYELASSAVSASDSLANALLAGAASPISAVLDMPAAEVEGYVAGLSSRCTLRAVADVLAENSSLARGLSTVLVPPEGLPSLAAVAAFSADARAKLDLLLDTTKQEEIKKNFTTKNTTLGRFAIRSSTQPPADDTAISQASYSSINRQSVIGGAVFAANAITGGIGTSLKEPQPPAPQSKWGAVIEGLCKAAFKGDAGDTHCTKSSTTAIDRSQLNVPADDSPRTVIDFVIASLEKKAAAGQQTGDSTQMLVDLLRLLTTDTPTVGDIVRSACGKAALSARLPLCKTRGAGGPSDAEIARHVGQQIGLPQHVASVLRGVSGLAGYVNYARRLRDYKGQMTARALFDAFVNGGECPGYLAGLPVDAGLLKECRLPGLDPAALPPALRNYTLLAAAPFLLSLALLLLPAGTFVCGIVGAARLKTRCAGCSLCCNGCVVLWASLLLAVLGAAAVVFQKLALEHYSGLLGDPDRFLRGNYDTVLRLLRDSGAVQGQTSVPVDLGSLVLRHTGHAGLAYTAPSSAVLDYGAYDALRGSFVGVTATAAVGSLPSVLGVPSEPGDSMASLRLSTAVETTRMTVKDLLYYNKRREGILDILGLPDLMGGLRGLLPAAVPAAVSPDSSVMRYLEAFVAPYVGSFTDGIREAFVSGELADAALFGDFSAGYRLYSEAYSSEAKRDGLYGGVDAAALAAMNVTAQVAAYVEGISSSASYSALSLDASAAAVRGQRGIAAECLSMVYFLDALVAMTACPSGPASFLGGRPVDAEVCSKSGIKATMQTVRAELASLNASCPGISASLASVVRGSPYPGLVGNLCRRVSPQSDERGLSVCVANTYAAVRTLVYALQEQGLQTIGWGAADGSPGGALDVVLDTARVYERFVDVFDSWTQGFTDEEVSFVDAYTGLFNAVASPLSILLDVVEVNLVSKNLSGGMRPRFSPRMYDTVVAELGRAVSSHLVEPLSAPLGGLLDALAGNQGLLTPYVLEAVPEGLRSLTLGAGALETLGAVFFCQYLIWAGLFFGGVCQSATFRYLYGMERMRSKAYKEAMIENSMSAVSLVESELFPFLPDGATELSMSRVYSPADSTTQIFGGSGQLTASRGNWSFGA